MSVTGNYLVRSTSGLPPEDPNGHLPSLGEGLPRSLTGGRGPNRSMRGLYQ